MSSTAAPDPVPHSPLPIPPSVRTAWTILRICIEERLTYRGDFAIGTLMRFLPVVTQAFLWSAVFAGAGQPSQIGGFSSKEFVAYYLLTYIARAFSIKLIPASWA